MKLFYLKFLEVSANFFPLEVLNQGKVSSLLILIDKTQFNPKQIHELNNEEKKHNIAQDYLTKDSFPVFPLYYKFKHFVDPYAHYRQVNVPVRKARDIYDKEYDCGCILHHTYFTMPYHVMMVQNYEILENMSELKKLPKLERVL
mmetsp:Transcript_39987/g.38526  ORF Transcript_39987/g.38526 Transcript_39987/m.38526 type:complete len:145 (-) Transcript_39987:443-877(-)